MIISERAVERRIKRANTDWWINEKAIVGTNGKTYIGYFNDIGEIHVKELDARCSHAVSRDVTLTRLNGSYADEHNAPSVCILENGRIMAAYTAHAMTHTLKYRITERPFDLDSFGPEKVLHYQSPCQPRDLGVPALPRRGRQLDRAPDLPGVRRRRPVLL